MGRRQKKRDYRALWIARISAACREGGISYSKFIAGLKKAGVGLNRKMLAIIAVDDQTSFRVLVEQAKAELAK